MTYCIAMLLDAGLVMMADTRTNAGVDNISVYRKLHLFGDEQRFIAIATAGNLSVTQSTLSKLEEGVLNPETGKLKRSLRCPHCFGRCSLWGVYFATRDTK